MLRKIRPSGNPRFLPDEQEETEATQLLMQKLQSPFPRFPPVHFRPWQQALKDAVRDPRELCRILALPTEFEAPAIRAARLFPLFAPRSYLDRVERGNPRD